MSPEHPLQIAGALVLEGKNREREQIGNVLSCPLRIVPLQRAGQHPLNSVPRADVLENARHLVSRREPATIVVQEDVSEVGLPLPRLTPSISRTL